MHRRSALLTQTGFGPRKLTHVTSSRFPALSLRSAPRLIAALIPPPSSSRHVSAHVQSTIPCSRIISVLTSPPLSSIFRSTVVPRHSKKRKVIVTKADHRRRWSPRETQTVVMPAFLNKQKHTAHANPTRSLRPGTFDNHHVSVYKKGSAILFAPVLYLRDCDRC